MSRFESAAPGGTGWNTQLEGLVETRLATRIEDVIPLLAWADAAARNGRWAAVAVSYDAAPAFEPALGTRSRRDAGRPPENPAPLVWIAIFERGSRVAPGTSQDVLDARSWPLFEPAMDEPAFCDRVRRVQEFIRAGDVYQVNLTFPLHARLGVEPRGWYEGLRGAQHAGYCAWLDMGRHLVLSFSPELFFERRGTTLRARPMKGTIRRGRWLEEDERMASALATSSKSRAENVMIVDLLRNDLGRVARTGSVHVPHLFTVERYPTLWQMTSTVEASIPETTPLVDLFIALFPCGSVTGAPKIRAMEVIDELEPAARALYTGAIGLIEPGGDCTFSVAIRTIVVDREAGLATMGIGAGITADSVPEEEYAECLLKSAFATDSPRHAGARDFALLETMRLEGGAIARLDRHLRRMAASARYFEYEWQESRVRDALERVCDSHPDGCWRLRLTSGADGTPDVSCVAYVPDRRGEWRVAFAESPVDARDPFLFNKTTRREVYEAARRGRPGVDDVLLWNEDGEVTESTIANLVVEIDGVRWTPPIESGLLAGTLRADLLASGDIRERVMRRGEVARAPRLWLINSLRGWIDLTLVR